MLFGWQILLCACLLIVTVKGQGFCGLCFSSPALDQGLGESNCSCVSPQGCPGNFTLRNALCSKEGTLSFFLDMGYIHHISLSSVNLTSIFSLRVDAPKGYTFFWSLLRDEQFLMFQSSCADTDIGPPVWNVSVEACSSPNALVSQTLPSNIDGGQAILQMRASSTLPPLQSLSYSLTVRRYYPSSYLIIGCVALACSGFLFAASIFLLISSKLSCGKFRLKDGVSIIVLVLAVSLFLRVSFWALFVAQYYLYVIPNVNDMYIAIAIGFPMFWLEVVTNILSITCFLWLAFDWFRVVIPPTSSSEAKLKRAFLIGYFIFLVVFISLTIACQVLWTVNLQKIAQPVMFTCFLGLSIVMTCLIVCLVVLGLFLSKKHMALRSFKDAIIWKLAIFLVPLVIASIVRVVVMLVVLVPLLSIVDSSLLISGLVSDFTTATNAMVFFILASFLPDFVAGVSFLSFSTVRIHQKSQSKNQEQMQELLSQEESDAYISEKYSL